MSRMGKDAFVATENAGVDASAIRAQVERISRSPQFGGAPQLCRLLAYLVDRALTGDVRDVKEYALGVELFERGPKFDPSIDTIVRVNAGRLRRRLARYYEDAGRADFVRIDIPRGHYRAEFHGPAIAAAPTTAVSNAALELLRAASIAKQVGTYTIEAWLGAGDSAAVYRAVDRMGRRIALKMLVQRYANDPSHVSRFVQESRAVLALNHPNVVTVHDVGLANGAYYIAMGNYSPLFFA